MVYSVIVICHYFRFKFYSIGIHISFWNRLSWKVFSPLQKSVMWWMKKIQAKIYKRRKAVFNIEIVIKISSSSILRNFSIVTVNLYLFVAECIRFCHYIKACITYGRYKWLPQNSEDPTFDRFFITKEKNNKNDDFNRKNF